MSGSFFAVGAEQDGLNLHFIVPTLRKERANGAVGQAAREDFLFTRTAFALEIASRDLACSRSAFTVIDRQRKEVLSFFCRRGRHSGNEDDRLAHLNCDSSVGLLCQLAGFDDDFFASDVRLDLM